jgi:hypothetical protein
LIDYRSLMKHKNFMVHSISRTSHHLQKQENLAKIVKKPTNKFILGKYRCANQVLLNMLQYHVINQSLHEGMRLFSLDLNIYFSKLKSYVSQNLEVYQYRSKVLSEVF